MVALKFSFLFLSLLSSAIQTSPSDYKKPVSALPSTTVTNCAKNFSCLLGRAQKCLPTTGVLSATNHPLNEWGQEDKMSLHHFTLTYIINGVQKDEYESLICLMRLKQTQKFDNKQSIFQLKCSAPVESGITTFFKKWHNKEFFNSMMAYCNIRSADEDSSDGSLFPWECDFPEDVHCVLDRSPWTPPTHGY